MGWKILILIPKGNKYNRGIGLLKVLWKDTEVIIDTRIKKAMMFHDVQRRFIVGRGTGKIIKELKIVQDLASVDQDSLFLVFLDLIKLYDNLERRWILKTLEGYGVGPKILV